MTRRRPSVAIAATSMPSSEVPLIRPSAFRRFVLDDPAMSPNTPAARSAFLTVATERGFIHQCTDVAALDARLTKGPVTAYVGYDCTADSLHIGNLMSIMLLRERDQPLSFLEFNYLILQAYDFLELSRRQDCELQMGGSDQWGNIVSGVELARRSDGRTLFGLTTPLVTTASGEKMGKTAQGAVWLNAERLSAYEYWQFWRNTEDADVGRFMRLFTELPLADIAKLEGLRDAEINEAKKVLATEATALCHGREAAEAGAETAREVFEAGGAGGELPEVALARDMLERGLPAFGLFARAGLAASNSEARRLIKGGGARVNDVVVKSETQSVSLADLDAQGLIKLSAGRKRHAIVRPS